jgi:carboxypeptidase D
MNNGSWDEFANLLFVDNPVGTGFSYVETDSFVRELDEMANQFVVFLEKWFALFPDHSLDDVSFIWKSAGRFCADVDLLGLYRWRIFCGAVHSLHCKGNG